MPLTTHWPLNTSFAGVPSLQANGSAGLSGDMSPSGVAGRLEIVRDPIGMRGNVMMSRLYEDDAYSGNGNRSEIADAPSLYDEYWYTWAMMLGDDWGDMSRQFSLMQLHDTPDGGDGLKTPTFILGTLSGHLRGMVPDATLPAENQVFVRVGSAGLQAMRWYTCCVHANWKTSGVAGFRELFIDGVPVFRQYNLVTNYTDVAAPFLKIGIYNGLLAPAGWGVRTAYYSDMRVWRGSATYEQGAGRPLVPPAAVSFAS